jgi:hypothetical protein
MKTYKAPGIKPKFTSGGVPSYPSYVPKAMPTKTGIALKAVARKKKKGRSLADGLYAALDRMSRKSYT